MSGLSDGPQGSVRALRAERQRAARRARTRRALVVCGAIAGVVLLAGAAYVAWTLLATSKPARTPLAVQTVPGVSSAPVGALATLKAAAEATRDDTLTVIAVGDLLFSLGPARLIKSQGGAAPLAKVAGLLKDADITIANLECPLSTRGAKVTGKPDHLIFRAPPEAVESLTTAGVDIVALANNHMMDYGAPAMEDTLRTLDTAGVAHAGGGMNTADAWKPAIVERGGKKVAYLSFTQRIPSYFMPTGSTAGIASGKASSSVNWSPVMWKILMVAGALLTRQPAFSSRAASSAK